MTMAPTTTEPHSEIAHHMLQVLPLFRKKLLHMDIIQKKYHVSLSHVQVLTLLQDNGAMSVSEISRLLGIAKPNITPLIDFLVENGYVSRVRDAVDRRVVNIAILPEGEKKLGDIRTAMETRIHEWMQRLPREDQEAMVRSLACLARVLAPAMED